MTITRAGSRDQSVEGAAKCGGSTLIQSSSQTSDRNEVSACRLNTEPQFLSLS